MNPSYCRSILTSIWYYHFSALEFRYSYERARIRSEIEFQNHEHVPGLLFDFSSPFVLFNNMEFRFG
jgi:hypothetical protein